MSFPLIIRSLIAAAALYSGKKAYHAYRQHQKNVIPKSWLTKRVSEDSPIAEGIRAKMQPGDELWHYAHLAPLASRIGYAIVRNGIVVDANCIIMS
jgi:hypothetical protein